MPNEACSHRNTYEMQMKDTERAQRKAGNLEKVYVSPGKGPPEEMANSFA